MNGIFTALGPEGLGSYAAEFVDGELRLTRVSRPPQGVLIPGLVDLHLHGAFGIDWMAASREEMLVLVEKLEAQGYEGVLPTTVSASVEAVRAALDTLPEHPAIWGFHLEGPFLSPRFPGAQPFDALVLPPQGPSSWDEVLEDPRLRLVTLAPELPGALELSARLMRRGVIVSMGHTNATYDEARFGFEFGVSHVTHCFNAMRGLHHREAGALGYALTQDGLTAELIYDRRHVSKEAAALLLRLKPEQGVIGVSDGTMASGMPLGTKLTMWGQACVVTREGVRLEPEGGLAGSAVTLMDVFRLLSEDFGLETAIRLCCLNPRARLGRSGSPRVYLELDSELRLRRRWVRAPESSALFESAESQEA